MDEGWNDDIGGTFQLLDGRWYNSSRQYWRGNFTYESPFIFLKPLNRWLGLVQQERLYGGILFMPHLNPYIELGYGIGTYKGREGLNWIKEEMAEETNLERKAGSLADMLVGADVFIGVSAPGTVTTEMLKTMNKDAIVFACANPTPEIFPDAAKAGGARVISTGRSDYPNQINNVLAFPGIFRGAFDVRASDINEEMKVAAAEALAGLVGDELSEDYIIPAAFDPRVGPAVAKAVAEAARRSGVARL